eukprot:6737742-Lingulodinium_polyedra.AAC.1
MAGEPVAADRPSVARPATCGPEPVMRSVRRQFLPALAGRCRRACAGSGEAQREAEGRAEGP